MAWILGYAESNIILNFDLSRLQMSFGLTKRNSAVSIILLMFQFEHELAIFQQK